MSRDPAYERFLTRRRRQRLAWLMVGLLALALAGASAYTHFRQLEARWLRMAPPEELQMALRSDPDNPDEMCALSARLLADKDRTGAARAYRLMRRATQLAPRTAIYELELGLAAARSGKP